MMLALLTQASFAMAIEDELASPRLRGANIGVCVREVGGTERFSKNGDERLTPASNQKLLSVAYALARLGPSTQFETRIWKTAKGWYVDAPGHPDLSYADLAAARESLGIKKGSAIFVRQAYTPRFGPGWEWDDLPNRYAAQPAAFTVDRGGFELWGHNKRFFLKPANYGVTVKAMGGSRRRVAYDLSSRVIRVWGPKPAAAMPIDTLAVPAPDEAAAMALGGKLVATADPPPETTPDLVLRGAPLSQIATVCLQDSDNNYAENLLLMAAAKEGPLGDDPYETAAQRLKAFLATDVGIESDAVRPVDGSGLSRHNLVTPRALAKLLEFGNATWGTLWTDAMAKSGVGTLKSRLAGSPFRGKTGSLNSVQSISGYSVDAASKPLVIVLVFNNTVASASEIRTIQDAIVRKIESFRDGTDFDDHDHREGRHPNPGHPALRKHRSR